MALCIGSAERAHK